MALSENERQLAERYLNDELSGRERDEFEKKIAADGGFKNEIQFLRSLYEGVQLAREEQLSAEIRAHLKYRKTVIPFALKLILAFIFVTTLGILFWFYVGNEFDNNKQHNFFFSYFIREKKNEAPAKKNTAETKSNIPRREESSEATDEEVDSIPQSSADTVVALQSQEEIVADSIRTREENIVVKKDQLLVTSVLAVEDKGEKKPAEQSLANETAQRLNPAAGLPLAEDKIVNYEVEFWASPVNYKGYKMSKNKIILFGIDDAEGVKLFRIDDALYMKYQHEFYLLNTAYDFTPYQKLKDSEIPLSLK